MGVCQELTHSLINIMKDILNHNIHNLPSAHSQTLFRQFAVHIFPSVFVYKCCICQKNILPLQRIHISNLQRDSAFLC